MGFGLDRRYWIWQWAEEGQVIKSSSVYKLSQRIQSLLDESKAPQISSDIDSNVLKATIDETTNDIVPVIYQPAVDSLKNFLREVHCAKRVNTDTSVDVEVSLIFNKKYLERVRERLTGQSIIETFRIHIAKNKGSKLTRDNNIDNIMSPNGEEVNKIYKSNDDFNYFTFPGIYSKEYGIEYDNIHGDSAANGIVPRRAIKYYFNDENHTIIFINTVNHAMSGFDNNHALWKWEYIPWLKDSPVKLGEKSREELNRS